MFRINPHFEQIPDETLLWRYMPFNRLKSIVTEHAIFFTKASTYDDDPFEGSYNRVSEEHYMRWMISDLPGETLETVSEEIRHKLQQNLQNSLWFSNKFKDIVLVSCWHMSEYESVAMWKLYSNYENGVAIRTTYGRLKESLQNDNIYLYGGKIRYINIHKDLISFGNTLAPFAVKRISFSHEKEVRLVTIVKHDNQFNYNWEQEQFSNGKLIPCNVAQLIEHVFVAPKYSEEFLAEVTQLIAEAGINVPVSKSDIVTLY